MRRPQHQQSLGFIPPQAGLTAWGLLLVTLLLSGAQPLSAQPTPRRMAITVDDLPFNCTCDQLTDWQELTRGLLDALERHEAPAIGFVNEVKLYPSLDSRPRDQPIPAALPEASKARIKLLADWLDAGHQLGNHSFSHPDLHRTALAEFQADVLRGEKVLRPLLAAREARPRFFRHPFLHSGRELATKRAFEQFLDEHQYRIAPVTIDNSEWIYARAFDVAIDRGDRTQDQNARRAAEQLAARVADAYLDYMVAQTVFFEGQSEKLLHREIPQVLLLHANRLNAAALDRLLSRFTKRGYGFVPLDEVLEDAVYERSDDYTGAAGMSWLQRWAWAEGHRGDWFAGEPEVEDWVRQLSGL